MQYLLHDLIKLPLADRIYLIERAISSLSGNETDLSDMIRLLERSCANGSQETKTNMLQTSNNL